MEKSEKYLKYFTPDIEDIRIGYKCEYLFGGEFGIWTNGFGLGSAGFPELWEIKANPKILRTPYLTKEQIEAEGWIDQNDRGMSENNGYEFHKGIYILKYWTIHPRLRIERSVRGVIFETGNIEHISINELRYISKFLKIN